MDWSNKQQVLEAVERSGWDLQFASDELRHDRDVILKAVENYSGALEFIADDVFEKFCDDKEVMMTATDGGWDYVIIYLSDRLKKDEEVISCIRAGIFDEDELHEFIQRAVNVGVTEETLLNAGIELLDILKALRRETIHTFEFDEESFRRDMKKLSKEELLAIRQELKEVKEKLEREQEEKNKQEFIPVKWITDELIIMYSDAVIDRRVETYRIIEDLGEKRVYEGDLTYLEKYYSVELSDSKARYLLREVPADTKDDEVKKYLYI